MCSTVLLAVSVQQAMFWCFAEQTSCLTQLGAYVFVLTYTLMLP